MYERNLDYFRGLFSSFIVFIHTYQILLLPKYYTNDDNLLKFIQYIGLDIVGCFFLISGYSIAYNLHSNYNKNNKNINIKYFFKNRLVRVMPPLIYSLFIVVLVVFIIKVFDLNGSESYRLSESLYVPREKALYDFELIFYNLFFLPSVVYDINTPTMNGPLWSVNFEIFFYIILASLFIIATTNYKSTKFWISLFIIVSIFAFQLFYKKYVNMSFIYFFIYFLMGVSTYFISYKKIVNIATLKIIFFTLFVLIIFLLLYDIRYFIPYKEFNIYPSISLVLAFLILFYAIFLRNKKLILDMHFISVSKYSYTLYIVHFPLLLLSLSLFHDIIYDLIFVELLLLLVIINIFIFKFCKVSSYYLEKKNYK